MFLFDTAHRSVSADETFVQGFVPFHGRVDVREVFFGGAMYNLDPLFRFFLDERRKKLKEVNSF